MRIILGRAAIFIGAFALTFPVLGASFTDPFNGPTVDPAWTVDRYLPQSLSIQNVDGHSALQMGVTTSGFQGSGSFYNYQGIQRAGDVIGHWTASAQIDITAQLLSGNANAGFWLRTGNGTDEKTADYDILAFRNPGGSSPGFYSWDDINGAWLLTGASVAPGWHDLQMSFTGSAVVYTIDGIVVRTDSNFANPLYADHATTAFLEMYNYGDRNYTANFDNVSVTPDGGSTMAMLGGAMLLITGLMRRSRK